MLSVEPTNGQTFKSTYVVRVAKKAFKNPEDIKACGNQVDKALAGGGKLYGYIEGLRALFGMKSTGRIATDINGNLLDLKEKEGMHTFTVLSGAERDEFLKKLSFRNLMKEIKSYTDAGVNPDSKQVIDEIMRKFRWKLLQRPIQEIEVESLADLKQYVGKL